MMRGKVRIDVQTKKLRRIVYPGTGWDIGRSNSSNLYVCSASSWLD